MSIATFTFDEAKHEYRVNDRVIPSVTQIIGTVVPGWQADPWYLQRGTALHLACRLADERRLDYSTVDQEIRGRLAAWLEWQQATGTVDPVAIETGFACIEGFAGTLDRMYDMGPGGLTIVDIKSSIAPQVRLQLAAYAMLWNSHHVEKVQQAVAVELRDDETFRTLWMNKRELALAGRQFIGALSIYNFMAENGLLPRKD